MSAANGRANGNGRALAASGATFDLDAAASAAEAEGKPFRFSHLGNEYEIPRQEDWPLTVFGALARGDLEAALRDLLGEAEWDKLAPGFTLGRLDLLFTAIAAEAGFDLKNSGLPQQRVSILR